MSDNQRIVIVGGVAGGASAAARARRISETAQITLIERGDHVSFANCGLPYHIGGDIADRRNLLIQTPEQLEASFAMRVLVATEAVAIDRQRKAVRVRELKTGQEREIPYDALILAPGAEPVRPPIPGGNLPRVRTLRNLADMDAIKQVVDQDKPRHAVVVGGGYIGLEMAEALRRRGLGVTLAEQAAQVMAPADPEMAAWLHQHLRLHGVDLRLATSVVGVAEGVGGVMRAELSDGQAVDCGLVVMAVGVRPENRLAKEAGLALGARGGIVVDAQMRTSDPAIFAVGDAVEVRDLVLGAPAMIPLAGPANRQGRIAADAALGRAARYTATQGTAACKVFDLTFAMTGASEKALRAAGRPLEKVYLHPGSHAGYYPGATPIRLKLIFDPRDGKVLGAQAVGHDGVDKRVDVLATAIRAGMTVYDLEELELAYAPPYGSAKDAVNMAGFAAANALRGDVALAHAPDADNPGPDRVLVDVRTAFEHQGGAIPGGLHIPVTELRGRLAELPRDKEIIAYCQVGLRGYLAARILTQNGFRARNLSGGYLTWQSFHGLPEAARPLEPATGVAGVPLASSAVEARVELDACGLQCPGPVMRLVEAMRELAPGEAVRVKATDPGFVNDIPAWAQSTGNTLESLEQAKGVFTALVRKGGGAAPAPVSGGGVSARKKSIVVFSGDLDKAIAGLIIANGARSMGSEVVMFFTFWGLNILRKPKGPSVPKTLIEKAFGWMMPKGTPKLGMSRMNFGGAGARLIRWIMRTKNVLSVEELLATAQRSGVRLVACNMSMDIMGIKREELIDGVEEGGVAMYLHNAEQGSVNLFI